MNISNLLSFTQIFKQSTTVSGEAWMRTITKLHFRKDIFLVYTMEGADNCNCNIVEMDKYNHDILFSE